jgi:hypothetical protein
LAVSKRKGGKYLDLLFRPSIESDALDLRDVASDLAMHTSALCVKHTSVAEGSGRCACVGKTSEEKATYPNAKKDPLIPTRPAGTPRFAVRTLIVPGQSEEFEELSLKKKKGQE